MKKIFTKLLILFTLVITALGIKEPKVVFASSNTVTAVFNTNTFGSSNDIFNCDQEGLSYYDDSGKVGVQINVAKSGAGATSKASFENVTNVTFTYCTNAARGQGTVNLYENNTLVDLEPFDASEGTTRRTISFNTSINGKVKFSIDVTENSFYLYSVSITFGGSSIDIGEEEPDTPVTPVTPITDIDSDEYPSQYEGTYYNSISSTSSTSSLLNSLSSLINKNTRTIGYGNLWDAYEKTDLKPGTNIIWDMYSNSNFTFDKDRDRGSHNGEGVAYNREHTIPQSWFGSQDPMYSDIFNVYPTDGYVNEKRANYPHGNVKNASMTFRNGSKLGNCSSQYYTATVYEPIDEYKGDFARTYFYMACRYKDKLGSWVSNGNGAGSVFKSSFPYLTDFGLSTYLEWAKNDPVSEKEINRNEAGFKLQGNRNPFIDHQDWIFKIWDLDFYNKLGDGGNTDTTPTPQDGNENGLAMCSIKPTVQLACNYSVSNNQITVKDCSLTYKIKSNEKIKKCDIYLVELDDSYNLNSIENGGSISQLQTLQNNSNHFEKVSDNNKNEYTFKKTFSSVLEHCLDKKQFVAIAVIEDHIYLSKVMNYSLIDVANKLLSLYSTNDKEYYILKAIINKTN